LKIGFIGDVVGKPGRLMIKCHLTRLKQEHFIDYTIANYENASHGFGLTEKNCKELLGLMTGGNHSFDKKEILNLFNTYPLIRPMNYPRATPGKGVYQTTLLGKEVAILNLMGHYTMPLVDNPFTMIVEVVASLKAQEEDVSAVLGTHTHVATDDLQITDGCCYVTDIGLTGCRDGVIGMSSDVPVKRFLTGLGGHFDVPDECKVKIFN
jgi:calcineurin-like phosphoesterase